ncbi:MAG: pyridoxamine 5'-phosphate oxidase family protein [Pseudoprimorskyibacter sp.]|nr:pyridoxamine 5'-phosphate oxidase family protein [Pseudoprimorskyibacter sp.]
MQKIKDCKTLEARYGVAVPLALTKVASELTPLYQAWIEGSRFCILSTVGARGVNGSPRGDDGPVVRVDGPKRLLMPDWKGNNRLDCLRDIVDDGRLALIFLVPGSTTTVRVNGTGWVTDDTDLRRLFARKDVLPATVIGIDINEVYTQCAKALIRSGLWTRNDKDTVPSVGDILAEMTDGAAGGPEYDHTYKDRAQKKMW